MASIDEALETLDDLLGICLRLERANTQDYRANVPLLQEAQESLIYQAKAEIASLPDLNSLGPKKAAFNEKIAAIKRSASNFETILGIQMGLVKQELADVRAQRSKLASLSHSYLRPLQPGRSYF